MCRGLIKVDFFLPVKKSNSQTNEWLENEMLEKFGGFTVDDRGRRGEWKNKTKHVDDITKYEVLVSSEDFNPSYFRSVRHTLEEKLQEEKILIQYQTVQEI